MGELTTTQPAFDSEAMIRLLDGTHHDIREEIRLVLAEPAFRTEVGLDRATHRSRVLAGCRELAARRYGSLAFPEAYGGAGDPGRMFAAVETLAFGDLSILLKFGAQFILFGGSIQQLGTRKHHERFLRSVGTFELPGCFAMTETAHGSNVNDIRTVATYDPGREEFVLRTPNEQDRKDYIGNAALHARMATVFAQLEVGGRSHGVHALLVAIRDAAGQPAAGVRIEDCGEKLGLNGVDNGRLWFDAVKVPRDNLLDRFGQVSPEGAYTSPISSSSKRLFAMLGTLVGARLGIGLAALSATKLALTIAVRYASRRRQFGPPRGAESPIIDYPTCQRRLMPRLATTYALDFALKHLVQRYLDTQDRGDRELESLVAGLKAITSWHATDTIQHCREVCGGQGYLAVNRLAALKADTDLFTTGEGDNTVLLQLVGRTLAAQGGGSAGIHSHLRDRSFPFDLLRWRAGHSIGRLTRQLERRIGSGVDSLQAANECQNLLIETAQAEMESFVAEQFAEGIDQCSDVRLRPALNRLLRLYALCRMDADRGWFLERGRLEAGKARAIRKLVDELCSEVRHQAVPLVDGFGVPAVCLPSIAA